MLSMLERHMFVDSAFNLISRRLRSLLLDLRFYGKTECTKQFLLIATITDPDGIRLDVMEDKGR